MICINDRNMKFEGSGHLLQVEMIMLIRHFIELVADKTDYTTAKMIFENLLKTAFTSELPDPFEGSAKNGTDD